MATFAGNQNDNIVNGTDGLDDMHDGDGKDTLYGAGIIHERATAATDLPLCRGVTPHCRRIDAAAVLL